VTPKLLTENPNEAKRRWKNYATAMQQNIVHLEKTKVDLEKVRDTANKVAKATYSLSKTLLDATKVDRFVYDKQLAEEGISLDNRGKETASLGSAASVKLLSVNATLAEQKKQFDWFQGNVKTIFGFDIHSTQTANTTPTIKNLDNDGQINKETTE
jgi:hypothetical protein